jgi:pyrimidine-nucleoside phosphorylase
MITAEILRRKRDGAELTNEEIIFLVEGAVSGAVSEAQIGAFLMSACINKLSARETGALTFAMARSGKYFDFKNLGKPVIDKHSTGGVGDKISLLLVPIVAACGVNVPMISGRGLGHTGGTVDKLHSISGFKMDWNEDFLKEILQKNGGFMMAQTLDVAPADRILYALRDVTGTVESTGLITASILSKKLAEGLDGLVMDMKVGSGAFMPTLDAARELAESMMNVAREVGLKMRLIFTNMDEPLGYAIGNWLEIEETIEALKGNCPADIREITEKLATAMLMLGGEKSEETAFKKVREVWENREAFKRFLTMVELQGGDLEKSRERSKNMPQFSLKSDRDGIITAMNTREIGVAAIALGTGRLKQTDEIDYGAGILLKKKIGDKVLKGEEIAVMFTNDKARFKNAGEMFLKALKIEDVAYFSKEKSLILDEWSV